MEIDLAGVLVVLALQFLSLGWRVAREADGRERHPFPWVPVPDNVNVAAMVAVAYACVYVPLADPLRSTFALTPAGSAVLAAAVVLLVAHPLVVAAHYRLWSGTAAADRSPAAEAQPYCTRQEGLLQLVAIIAAAAAFVRVLGRAG